MEEYKAQPQDEKKPALLKPLLLWPLVGIPVFWGLVGLFWITLPDRGELELAPMAYGAMTMPVVCFGIGSWVGVRFARRSRQPGKRLPTVLLIGFTTAFLGSAYNFGACALFIPLG